MNFSIVVPIICILISILFYLIFGREKKIFTAIQTEPPRKFNPMEVALIYNKKTVPSDAVTMLHFLASKEYIKIIKTPENKILLTKLKDYDGSNAVENFILNETFANSDLITIDEIKRDSNINASFQVAANIVNENENIYHFFSKTSHKIKHISKIINYSGLIILNLFLYIYGISNKLGVFSLFIMIAVVTTFQIIGIYVIGSGSETEIGFGGRNSLSRDKNRIKNNLLAGSFLIAFASFAIFLIIFTQTEIISLIDKIMIIINYILSLSLLCSSQIISSHIDKKTDYGIKIYQEIVGFKNYLNTVERSRLEKIFNENPSVFRNILSYGFVLGISKKWTNSIDDTIFNGIFSTAYGYDDSDVSKPDSDEVDYQKLYNILNNRKENIRQKYLQYNKLITTKKLNLFNLPQNKPVDIPKIYKKSA